jgi:hypothetical protein
VSDSQCVPKTVFFDGYFVGRSEKTTQTRDRFTPVPLKANPTCLGQPVVSGQTSEDVNLAPLGVDFEQINIIHAKIGEQVVYRSARDYDRILVDERWLLLLKQFTHVVATAIQVVPT